MYKIPVNLFYIYRIRPNYRTYPYIKLTVKQFRSLQITTSVPFVYFFIKTNIVDTHLNCIDLSMQFKCVPTTYVFYKENKKKTTTPPPPKKKQQQQKNKNIGETDGCSPNMQ